jgi:hypothetical protein
VFVCLVNAVLLLQDRNGAYLACILSATNAKPPPGLTVEAFLVRRGANLLEMGIEIGQWVRCLEEWLEGHPKPRNSPYL